VTVSNKVDTTVRMMAGDGSGVRKVSIKNATVGPSSSGFKSASRRVEVFMFGGRFGADMLGWHGRPLPWVVNATSIVSGIVIEKGTDGVAGCSRVFPLVPRFASRIPRRDDRTTD